MMVNDMLTSDSNDPNQPFPPNNNNDDNVPSPLQRTKAFTINSARSPKNLLVHSSSIDEDVVMTDREHKSCIDTIAASTNDDQIEEVQDYNEQDDDDDDDYDDEDDDLSPTLSITTHQNSTVAASSTQRGVADSSNRLSESSTVSSDAATTTTTMDSTTKLFPTMNLLDLSVLNKKPKLTSVMQHSFMITPKRIGSNLANS